MTPVLDKPHELGVGWGSAEGGVDADAGADAGDSDGFSFSKVDFSRLDLGGGASSSGGGG